MAECKVIASAARDQRVLCDSCDDSKRDWRVETAVELDSLSVIKAEMGRVEREPQSEVLGRRGTSAVLIERSEAMNASLFLLDDAFCSGFNAPISEALAVDGFNARIENSGSIQSFLRIPGLVLLQPEIWLLIYMYAETGGSQSPLSLVGSLINFGLFHHSMYIIIAHRICARVLISNNVTGKSTISRLMICASIQRACSIAIIFDTVSALFLSSMSSFEIFGKNPHLARSAIPRGVTVNRECLAVKVSRSVASTSSRSKTKPPMFA